MTRKRVQVSAGEMFKSPGFAAALLASSPDCVKLLTLDGRVSEINAAGLRTLEVSDPTEVIGDEWAQLWPPAHQAQVADAVARAAAGETVKFQGYCATMAGAAKWWDVAVSPVRDAAGEICCLLAVSRDHADVAGQDLEAAKAEVVLFENAFRHAPIGMALVSLEGAFLKLNQAFCDLVDYDEATLLALDFQAITHPADLDADLDNLRRLIAGEVPNYQMDKRYRRRDGTQVWANLSVSMVRHADGRPKHFISQIQDLSARREAQGLYRLMAKNVSDVVGLHDLDGRWLFVSPAAGPVFGYKPRELVGRSPYDLVPEAVHAELRAKHAQMVAEDPGKTTTHLIPMVRRDGREIWAEVSSRLVEGEVSGRTLRVSVTRDVTDRVESERRYRLIAENTTDAIVTTAMDGRMTYISPAIGAISGWSPAELIGERPVDYAHPDDAAGMVSAFERVAAGAEGVRVRWRGRKKAGGWVWLESRPSMLSRYSVTGAPEFLDVTRDVTDQVAQEEALAQATAAAQAAAAAKAEFLANMSHEIRTPLTAVLGFAGLLAERDDLSDQAQHFVERIGSASRGLLAIVNDVLDFSSLESGKVEIKPRAVSPVEVARDALLMFKSQADAKGLMLGLETRLAPAQRALVDPERVRQVLLNLIGNAVKFTDVGAVTVRLELAAGRLRVEVQDTGAGLDEAQRAKLFQRFSQVDASSTRRHGGTGLGLAICKGLVEAMDGEIDVTTEVGHGSTFFFEIAAPAVADDASSDEGAVPTALSIEGVRVLVADDNPANRELVRALLERLGAEVAEAADGVEAVEAAKHLPYDVILMDLRMPRLDGAPALVRIRTEEGPNQAVPVIAFSADTDLPGGGVVGFDGFVPKPIDAGQLIQVVWACAFGQLEDLGAEARHG